jgi:predicted TPR repeat methyltransferase
MSSKIKLRKLRFSSSTKSQTQTKLTKAIEEHKRGNVDAATKTYRQLLADDPEQVDALNFLGIAEHQLGHSEEALDLLGRALDLMPEHPDAHNNRGNVLKQLGRLDEAEADYRRVISMRPTDASALNNLGTVLRQRGDLEGAAATFRQAIAISPKQAAAWQNLGNVLGDLTRYDEALDAHREAMRLAPQSADCYRNLGAMLYSVDRVAEASEVYQQWLDRFPNDPRARHFVASCTGEGVPSRAPDDYVRAEFDGFAASFDEILARLEYRAPELVAGEVARLAGEPRANLQVLDAGCGTGLCGPLLRPWATWLAGVDLSPAMVDLARKRSGYDALVVEELTTYLAARPAAWDLIVSADTLVYFGALEEVIRAAAHALRPAGALIFTVETATPNDALDGFRINPHGRYSHTRDYLLRVLGDAGFAETTLSDVALRKEATRWVEGYLIGARIPPSPRATKEPT